MNTNSTPSSSWLVRAGQAGLLLATAACAQPAPTAAVAVPPVPAGEARIWVYRDNEPYAGKGLPAVGMNGAVVGAAATGRRLLSQRRSRALHSDRREHRQRL